MNLYFLMEGRRTEYQVYPEWIRYLLPDLKRVYNPHHVKKNNYYMISGMGYPSLLNYLKTSAEEVSEIGKYDYLVIFVDSEEETIAHRVWEIWNYVESCNIELCCKLKIIVQKRCIETWFLGNRDIFTKKPNSKLLRDFVKYYNVYHQDPEKLQKMPGYSTTAVFHYEYLKLMFREKKLNYSKKNTAIVEKKEFLQDLILRTRQHTEQMKSFQFFLEFFVEIKMKMK